MSMNDYFLVVLYMNFLSFFFVKVSLTFQDTLAPHYRLFHEGDIVIHFTC